MSPAPPRLPCLSYLFPHLQQENEMMEDEMMEDEMAELHEEIQALELLVNCSINTTDACCQTPK